MSDEMFLSRRSLLSAIGLGGAVLALEGCGSSGGKAAAGGASAGGVLKIAQSADVALPPVGQNNPNFSIARTVWNTLIEYEHLTLAVNPSLARSATLDTNATTLTLVLRDDVTFHTGRKFTADDVLWNIKYIQGPNGGSQTQHIAKAFTSVVADSPTQVTIKMAQPISNLFDLFEMMVILDKETFKGPKMGGQIIGTGPFKVDSYTPGAGFKLSKYPGYWLKGSPALDGVEMTVIKSSQDSIAALHSGKAHLILDLPPGDALALKADTTISVVQADANDSAYYIGADVSAPGLTDKRVRQAISYAIDRDRILTDVLGYIGSSSCLPWSATSPAYDAVKSKHYMLDLDQAKKLLAQVPGASGAQFPVTFNAALTVNAQIADIVVENLTALGLKPVKTPMAGPDFQAKLTAAKLGGLFVNNHGFGHLHPATLINGAFPYKATGNASNFNSDEYKKLARQLSDARDAKTLTSIASLINDLLLDQQFMIDLVVSAHTYTVTNSLQGLQWNMYDYIDLDTARLAQ